MHSKLISSAEVVSNLFDIKTDLGPTLVYLCSSIGVNIEILNMNAALNQNLILDNSVKFTKQSKEIHKTKQRVVTESFFISYNIFKPPNIDRFT